MTKNLLPPPTGQNDDAHFAGGRFWFDGILEGPLGDADQMRAELEPLSRLGLIAADIEAESGRFSLLVADERQALSSADGLDLERIRQSLEKFVRLSARPEACESTLRATEIGRDHVRETIFSTKQGSVSILSRLRPKTLADQAPPAVESGDAAQLKRRQQRRVLVIGSLVIAALAILWQAGVFGAFLAPAAEDLVVDAQNFKGLLEVEVAKEGLAYVIKLRRGPDFPRSPAAAAEAQLAAPSLERAAAIQAVSSGGSVFLELRDDQAELIIGREQKLGGLLAATDAAIETILPARMKSHSLRLVLTEDLGHKGR